MNVLLIGCWKIIFQYFCELCMIKGLMNGIFHFISVMCLFEFMKYVKQTIN